MKVIKKTFNVLDLFIEHADGLTLEEISRLSGINKPTARRIALGLVECGFLKQPIRRGKYVLGMKFLDFSKVIKSNNSIMDIAIPQLIKLNRTVDETVSIALWDGASLVICQSIHSNQALKVVSNEGTIRGLHFTSMGKAILAELSDEEINTRFAGGMVRSTPNSIADINDLKKHLIFVREEGVAFDDEEYAIGVRGVGAVLKNGEGTVVGAISVLGPAVRLTRDRLREYVPIVKQCSQSISKELGFNEK